MKMSCKSKRKHVVNGADGNKPNGEKTDDTESIEQKRLKETEPVNDEHLMAEGKMQDISQLEEHFEILKHRIQEKEEILRKLQMVKRYKTKNNLVELEGLISKWRSACQEALQDLSLKVGDEKPSLTELINHLQIDHKLILYNQDEECFM